jgi:hypothetical protein
MVDDTQNYWEFGLFHCLEFNLCTEISFFFLSHQILFPKRRVLYCLEFRTMEKVQIPINSVSPTLNLAPR